MRTLFASVIAAATATTLHAQPSITDTRLLAQPALSATQSRSSTRATSGHRESTAAMSGGSPPPTATNRTPCSRPTARRSRSARNYDGNIDVYIVPSDGRHAEAPDLASGRRHRPGLHARRKERAVHERPVELHEPLHAALHRTYRGGPETKLPIPNAARASYSPDGKRIAYNPIARRVRRMEALSRRHGVAHLVCTTSRRTPSKRSRSRKGAANDVDAQWIGDTVYFRSDRDGEFNVYAYDAARRRSSSSPRTRTSRSLNATAGGGKLVYEQAGYLHLLDPARRATGRKLAIGVAAD